MNGYGIPDYTPEPEWGRSTAWARWRCRRKGGHFGPIARFVLRGNIDANSLVCSNPKCRTYLGPVPLDYYASLEPPSPFDDIQEMAKIVEETEDRPDLKDAARKFLEKPE